jgi:rhodanese-related sulfurtransferase
LNGAPKLGGRRCAGATTWPDVSQWPFFEFIYFWGLMMFEITDRVRAGVAMLIACLYILACPAAAETASLTAANAYARANRGALLLIDVRTEKEWRETGLPTGATPVTFDQSREAFLAKVAQAARGSKTMPVALICGIGVRSAEMQEVLDLAGYAKVINVTDGITGNNAGPGWIARGLPMRKFAP